MKIEGVACCEFSGATNSIVGLTRAKALAVLQTPDDEILPLIERAWRLRRRHFGRRVKLNYLLNIRSGICPEDCFYCSQSKISKAPIERYPLLKPEEFLAAARRAVNLKAVRLCLVASGREASGRDIRQVTEGVRRVKRQFPNLKICACLGLLSHEQGRLLCEAGVSAYNHNLNTSARHHEKICGTHRFQDRRRTIENVKEAGLSICSGFLFGTGEADEDIVDAAFSLKPLEPDSIPVNFLIPIPGTPLEKTPPLSPQRCLKILCLFRLIHPRAEIRVAAGREIHLGWMQPLALYIANSIFIGDYLTTRGRPPEEDFRMIRELGFEIEGEGALSDGGAPVELKSACHGPGPRKSHILGAGVGK